MFAANSQPHLQGLALIMLLALGIATGTADSARAYPRPGRTQVLSVASDGSWGRAPQRLPGIAQDCGVICETDISADGRYAVFSSAAEGLVADDNNKVADVFLRDLELGTTHRVSVASDGSEAVGVCGTVGSTGVTAGSRHASISANGRYVVFSSCAGNLSAIDDKLAQDVFLHDHKTHQTELISVSSREQPATCAGQGSCSSSRLNQAISATGRFVAFSSRAPNLVEGDSNNAFDVFVRDRDRGTTERIPITSRDRQIGREIPVVVSDSGRYVAFLVHTEGPEAINNRLDVYWHDRRNGRTIQADVSDKAQEFVPLTDAELLHHLNLAISGNGRYVGFASRWNGFIPNDTNDAYDVFVKDMRTDRVERVSVRSTGEEVPAFSLGHISLSRDGRHVVFTSASRIAPDDVEGNEMSEMCGAYDSVRGACLNALGGFDPDVYLYDRKTGEAELISRDVDGGTTCDQQDQLKCADDTWNGSVSAGGRFVTFESDSRELVEQEDKYDGPYDFFVRDRGLAVGSVRFRAPRDRSIQRRNQFARHAYVEITDEVGDAASGFEGTDLLGMSLALRPALNDLFVRIDVESLPAIRPARVAHGSLQLTIVYGLRFLVGTNWYEFRAADSYFSGIRPRLGLFRCDSEPPLACHKIAALRGGLGTTGQQVVAAIPLDLVAGADESGFSNLRGFVGRGSYRTGVIATVDEVSVE